MRSRAAALCFAVILILLLFNPALSIAGWKSVSSNGSMTVAIGDDGSLWTWGENSHGLGDGETSRSSPGRIGLDNDWEMGVAGSGTGYALKKNGSLWAWGYNSQGQLGDGTTTGRATIGQVGTDVDWESVSSAWTCTLAIKKDGTLWAWGYNRYGQFGNETTTDSSVPLQIGTDNDWKTVSISSSSFISVFTGFTVPSTDANTPGVEREDGQSEANNLDSATGKPKIDLQYDFTIILQDPNGLTPQYVKLYMAQREDPSITDFFGVDLACTGEWGSGATCSLSTLLGPSAYHKYYFEAKLADGAVMRYPESGTIDGPAVELLNGFNMVSVPRDLTGPVDGTGAFSSSSTYRWVSGGLTNGINSGGYVKVDSSNPIKPGEGYFVMREASTLPSLESYSDVQTETYEVSLTQGWNMVSNPYGGNVLLKDINVKNSSGSLKSWNGAVADEWVVNAVYYYAGSDWGSTYAYQAAGGDPEASLVPWLGYWVYVKSTSDTYTLVIPKP